MIRISLIAVATVLAAQTATAKDITVDDLRFHNFNLRVDGFGGYMEEMLPKIRSMGFTKRQIAVLVPEIEKVMEYGQQQSEGLNAIEASGATLSQKEMEKIRDDLDEGWAAFDKNLRRIFDRFSTPKSNELVQKFQMETPLSHIYHPPLSKTLRLDHVQLEKLRDLQRRKSKQLWSIMREFDSENGKGVRSARNRKAIWGHWYEAMGVLNEEQLRWMIPRSKDYPKNPRDPIEFLEDSEHRDNWLKVPLVKKMWDDSRAKE